MEISRREFLKGTASIIAANAAAGIPLISASPAYARSKRSRMRIHYYTSRDGKMVPAPRWNLSQFYFMDLDYNPLLVKMDFSGEDGLLIADEPDQPYKMTVLDWVDGFGLIYVIADNGGNGYQPGELGSEFLINYEVACSRKRVVETVYNDAQKSGVVFDPKIAGRLEKAAALLALVSKVDPLDVQSKKCWEALYEGLWAGEEVSLSRAKSAISKRGSRPDFKFGTKGSKCLDFGEEYTQRFRGLFDFATLHFYYKGFEPQKGKPTWERMDRQVQWCERNRIVPKGHPLVYFHPSAIPTWLTDTSFDYVKSLHKHRIRRIVERYKGKIDYWDVINEAHDCANELRYTYEQLLDMTKMACEETKKVNPNSVSVVNSTALFGEYSAVRPGEKFPSVQRRTPMKYVSDCVSENMPFDVVGLQLYYQPRDLFEIDRLLDRFSRFGKPIHITEHSVSSENKSDEAAHEKNVSGQWHEPFSPEIQAEYLEQFWTIAYSKEYIKAITYWDFEDKGGHFWPHGGLLDAELKPKEAYYKLKKQVDSWRGM